MSEVLAKDGALIIALVACVIVGGFVLFRWNLWRPTEKQRSSVEKALHRYRVQLAILGGILWIGTVAIGAFDTDQGESANEGVLAATVLVTGAVMVCAYWSFHMSAKSQGPARERAGRILMTVGGAMLLLPFLWFQAVIATSMFLGALLRLNVPESVSEWRSEHLWFLVVGSGALLLRWALLPEKGAGWPGFILIGLFGLSWVAIGVTEKNLSKARH